MAPCYSKNGILKGTVDYYCLVCETYLKSETDNIDHIAKPIHRKNLDSTHYVKDFEEDFVRKIKKGYFCELCNKLLPMMSRVKIHVSEPSHIDSRNLLYFKRSGVNIIAFGKVVLNDKAWNGLNDDSCAFCNIEYEDEEIHKNLLSHILNIIQIKVEVDKNKNIYRKIDDASFQCLTCNMVLALNNITCHFEEDQHKHLYQECCAISLNKVNKNESDKTEDKKENKAKASDDLSDKVIDRLAMSLNKTEETSKQPHTTGSDLKKRSDVLLETTAIPAIPLNDTGDTEKEAKIAINPVVDKEVEVPKDTKDCFVDPLKKTSENKEDSKTVKDNDINKKNKNVEDRKEKKNKTKTNPPESNEAKQSGSPNEIVKTTRSKSSFNIKEYEKKICKILKAKDYITLDENQKTLCILCDWIMDPRNKSVHISGQHHQTMERMHKRRLAEMEDKKTKENKKENNRENNEIDNNKETVLQNRSILDMVSEFQENNVNINLIFNTAVCKKCTVNLPYDCNAIKEHILKHNDETDINDESKEILQSCEATDKETCENTSDVTIKEDSEGDAVKNLNEEKLGHKNEYDKPESEQVQCAEESFNNEASKNEAELVVNKTSVSENLEKQVIANYVEVLTVVKHLMFKDVIINEKICISVTSLNYLISIRGEIHCLICDELICDIDDHIKTLKHTKLFNEKPVITNEKSEFIREIGPELLHCGFCNMTVSSWSEMREHLKDSLHKEVRNAAEWRMHMYLEHIKLDQFKRTSQISELSLMNMFGGLY